jgi:hypothetical protein
VSAFWEVQKLGVQIASAIAKATIKGAARAGIYSVDRARDGWSRAQAADVKGEKLFEPPGRSALVHNRSVSAAPFMVDPEQR